MTMTVDYEQLLVTNEFSEVIRLQNQSLERLKAFRAKYPYLIPPNVACMVEENLKENMQMLFKEMNNLHKPKQQQKRYVCMECHGSFAVRLPGGLCDECRSRTTATQPDYDKINSQGQTAVVEAEVEPASELESEAAAAAEPPEERPATD